METHREQFIKNPSVNPKTGEKIIIGGKEYRQLTSEFGDIKVHSPETRREITVGKATYKKLLKQGYTQDYLLSLKGKPTYQETYINTDMWFNILLNSNIDDVASSCVTNKTATIVCNNGDFWKQYFEQYNIPYLLSNDPASSAWLKDYTSWCIKFGEDCAIEKPTNYVEWIKEYNKLITAQDKATMVIDAVKYEMICGKEMELKLDRWDESSFIPSWIIDNNISTKYITIYDMSIDSKGRLYIGYNFIINPDRYLDNLNSRHIRKPLTNTHDILTKIFYYNPNINIQDRYDGSSYVEYYINKNPKLSKKLIQRLDTLEWSARRSKRIRDNKMDAITIHNNDSELEYHFY